MQSLVTPFGYSAESCGYCKDASTGLRTSRSRASYYFSSQSLTVDVYQTLVDRGFRRSGTIFYKPDVLRHCCPHYTIRLPAADFKPSRDHRQAINKWNRHVLGETYVKEAAKLYPKSKEEKAKDRNAFDLGTTVHESQYDTLRKPPEPAHRFDVSLEPDTFTQEKYELFKNYQQNVHKEKPSAISENGFTRFLCSSPLHRETRALNTTHDAQSQPLGSYHQCYRLDGRLIAMAVLDLLPHCVSGVYFVYHSDFEKWNFGKLSALREAALALEGGYRYYYMGFYIHSCAKMRYKGEYRPSYVLDPETYDWNPLEGELRQLLDTKSYVSLARERRRQEAQKKSDVAENDLTGVASQVDDYSDFPMPTATEGAEAVQNGTSLFDLKVPGLMTAEDIAEQLDIRKQQLQVPRRQEPLTVRAENLKAWGRGDIRNPQSLEGYLGELIACIGPDAAAQVVVKFS